jgi:hypothetical protein
MPTIDIPDRICPHCGGTKWYVHTNKKGHVRHICFLKSSENRKAWRSTDKGREFTNTYFKTEVGKKHRKKYLSKPSTVKLRAELSKQKYHRDMKTNPEKVRLRRVKSNKQLRHKLTDGMVKHCIVRSYTESQLRHSDIPQELIEIKRKQLLLTRQIKNNGKDNSESN